MIRLDAATVLLQWATGGLFFLWDAGRSGPFNLRAERTAVNRLSAPYVAGARRSLDALRAREV